MQGTKRGATYFFKNRKAIGIMSEKVQQFINSQSNIRRNKIIQKRARSSSLFKNKKTQMQVTVRGNAYFFKIEKRVIL